MIALRFIASHRMCYIEDYLSSTEKFMLAIYLYVCVFVLVCMCDVSGPRGRSEDEMR